MKKILLSTGVSVFVAGALIAGATGAFFSDSETSTENTFTAGAIDLKIDNESYYNGVASAGTSWSLVDLTIEKFFDFLDLKPADYGEDTISLHVDNNDSYLCADITLTSNNDNGLTEPESLVDQTGGEGEGELANAVNFLWWADDGDNVLETDEEVISDGPLGALDVGESITVALADSETNIWTDEGGPVPGSETLYIGKAWCFGTISEQALTPDDYDSPAGDNDDNGTAGQPADGGILCDGSDLDNSTQSDSLTADVSFTAVQARHNDDFLCAPPPPRLACEAGQEWADAAGLFDQGRQKNGGLIAAARSNPANAFGAPQSTGTPYDSAPLGSFVSLGFGVGTTSTRSIVLTFNDNIIVNDVGNDVKIYEVTNGSVSSPYPDEHVKVEASKDGIVWTLIAADVLRDAEIDLGPLDWARYIRVTDINNPASFSDAVADGYDLDAVGALNCAQLAV